ncbi:hypothetical protein OCU04_008615 [Sclerotinia nivalis]|uniref:Short chain dehydrogenase/reductase n=1 Tax=Sclerotinia nivalis TaxID=352851 RepID=A0A9X0DHS8_9HELO|nr:hypothetical protein OCU04_008615 [Sclerotinia nivalis]
MKRSLSLPPVIKNSRFYTSPTFFRSSSLLQARIEFRKINSSLNIVNSGPLQTQSQPQSRITNNYSIASYTQSQTRTHTSTSNTSPKNITKMSTSQPQTPPSFAPGNTALITGGASGIGLSLAEQCIKYGMNVILVDNNGDDLGKAQMYLTQMSKGDQQVVGLMVDVGGVEEWETVREVVEGDFDGKLHLLALNAGTSQRGSFGAPTSHTYFSKILSVNLFGVINGINNLLPYITSHTSPSSIIITGSKQGITNPPGNPAYNCSKAAVKTLAEHLSWDLREKKETGVHLLVPGWTYTGLTGSGSPFIVSENGGETKVQRAGLEKKPKGAWSGDQVVEYLQEKMGEGKFYVVCPDGDVTEEMDRKRMAWGAGDLVQGRQPLSRWREEYKEEFEEFMKRDL